jgi:dCTP deaminase
MFKGALASQSIEKLIQDGIILNANVKNIQPSSLDLTLDDEIYRMKGVFLPHKGEKIRDIIKDGALYQTDFSKPLECNGVYLIKIKESLNLPHELYAYANNKSSSGRLNLQARLIADGVPYFDKINRGTVGELWVVVSPKSFSIKLEPGITINQIRFFGSDTVLSEDEYKDLYLKENLLLIDNQVIPIEQLNFRHDITMSINLQGDLVGYKCSPNSGKVIDMTKLNHYEPLEFFEPIYRNEKGQLLLKANEFYILSTIESIRVPKNYATEMIAYDPSKGEFRSHYAGFFDPGFGYGVNGEINGTPAVLEVITQDNDFILRHGQPICRMVYEKLSELPSLIYGDKNMGSHYQNQSGPKLSKHFLNI